jgi:hypothetical protein
VINGERVFEKQVKQKKTLNTLYELGLYDSEAGSPSKEGGEVRIIEISKSYTNNSPISGYKLVAYFLDIKKLSNANDNMHAVYISAS